MVVMMAMAAEREREERGERRERKEKGKGMEKGVGGCGAARRQKAAEGGRRRRSGGCRGDNGRDGEGSDTAKKKRSAKVGRVDGPAPV